MQMRYWKICLTLFVYACLALLQGGCQLMAQDTLEVWQSDKPLYGVLSKLEINKAKAQISAFEPCGEELFSWGWSDLEPVFGGYFACFDAGELTYELYLVELDTDQLRLMIATSYQGEPLIFLSQADFHREKR